jgi:hypothetical protein
MSQLKEGTKFDEDKPRFDLIPALPMIELARLYAIGAKKYDDRNWEKGISWGRIFRAMVGHAWTWWAGERFDKKDGQHHLSSVAWCALTLMEYERTRPEYDSREEINLPLKEDHIEGFPLDHPLTKEELLQEEEDQIPIELAEMQTARQLRMPDMQGNE